MTKMKRINCPMGRAAGLLLGLAVSGCSMNWPEDGAGGQAEWRPAPPPGETLDHWSGLGFGNGAETRDALAHWQKLNATLEAAAPSLIGERPALISQTRLQAQRTRRELEGGLLEDGRRDLAKLETMIDALTVTTTAQVGEKK